ncbi:MAG: nicotinate (nicotinamide) nucleotide adenylyltransferase [Bacteroidales bacterium]
MKTGLYFGSFNPIHTGHLIIANYFLEYSDLDELWFVISPHNPLKQKRSLLPDYHRLEMLRLAVEDDERFRVSDIELKLPTPSYTMDTLVYLEEKHPGRTFLLIMGSDGLRTFHKWKNAELIMDKYHRLIYPRPGSEPDRMPPASMRNATLVDAPRMDLSSSFIREAIAQGRDIRHFMPVKAYRYMRDMHFYEKE